MHEVSRFYGIVIKIYFSGNPPPHCYAIHREQLGQIDIATGDMVEGDLGELSRGLVKAWVDLHRSELTSMWHREEISTLPPLQ